MNTKHLALAFSTSALLLSGCANVTNGEHYASFDGMPDEVCIVKNPRVKITNALPAIQRAFERRNVRTHIVNFSDNCPCAYTVEYSARRSWDAATYLRTAYVELKKDQHPVARAKYQAGPFTLTKWGRTEERLDTMVGELFATK